MTTRALAAWLVLSAGGWPGPPLAGGAAGGYAPPPRRGAAPAFPRLPPRARRRGSPRASARACAAPPRGSTVDRHAVVVIDGVNVSARVLGPLRRTDGPAQTAGWLLQLERTPGALGPGARIEVRLQAAATSGLLVPAEALVYAEK